MAKTLITFGSGVGSLGESFLGAAIDSGKYDKVVSQALPQVDCTNENNMRAVASHLHDIVPSNHEVHVVDFVGMMYNSKIEGMTLADFNKVMQTNLSSLFLIARAVMPLLIRGNGRFVAIGSNAGEQGFTGMSAYCASKFGMQGFIQCMAKECAPYNIPVNIVNPGAFHPNSSTMSKIQVEQFKDTTGKSDAEVMDMLTSRIPMKRLATNDDLDDLLLALLNEYPRFYTGQSISLSGGQVMGK